MADRETTKTTTETITFKDAYFTMHLSKTDNKIVSILLRGRASRGNYGERLFTFLVVLEIKANIPSKLK